MDRISEKDVEAVCARINRAFGFDEDAKLWNRVGDRNVATIGMFYVDYAYGGVELHRMMNESGGVDDVFRCGHVPKRELYGRMHAFLDGIEIAPDTYVVR